MSISVVSSLFIFMRRIKIERKLGRDLLLLLMMICRKSNFK